MTGIVALVKSLVQKLIGGLGSCRLAMGVDDHLSVAYVLIKGDLGDVQALGNLVDAELLLAVERLGDDAFLTSLVWQHLPAA